MIFWNFASNWMPDDLIDATSSLIQIMLWWRHQMEAFSALLAIFAGNSPVNGEFPAQRPVTRSFDVFFDLRLNKRLSKQSWGWWFETLSRPLWRHCNGLGAIRHQAITWTKVNRVLLLVTPCLLTRIREFIHTQHRNTTRGRRPSVVLRC